MKKEEIIAELKTLQGKKSKLKPLKVQPKDTKETKLPSELQKALKEHFGANVKNIRVHAGGNAKEACKSVKAQAFVMGNNIFVSSPGMAKNDLLLAHELAHVLQAGTGKKLPKEKDGKVYVK